MLNTRQLLAASVLMTSAFGSSALAQTAPVVTSLVATHDSNVSRVLASWNFGSDVILDVDAVVKPELVRGLVRFDQAALAAAVGTKRLKSAKLVLTLARPAESSGTNPTMNAYRLTRAWNESSVTWSNYLNQGEPFDVNTPTARVVVPNGKTGIVELDVSSDVALFLAGTPNNGWILKDNGWDTGVHAAFVSTENGAVASRPKLVLELLDGYTEEGSAALTFPHPGIIVVDSTVSGNVIDVPQHGQTFANYEEGARWLAANLNGMLDYDVDGSVAGVSGPITEVGEFFYADRATGQLVPVDDIVAAKLGGRDGYVTVAGVRYCIREDGCEPGMAPMALPEVHRVCTGPNNRFCIKGTAFKHNFVVYRDIGAKLEQREGGYQEDRHLCWKGPIPRSCVRKRGSDRLEMDNLYQLEFSNPARATLKYPIEPQYPPTRLTDTVVSIPRHKEGRNVEQIKQREWSAFVKLKLNTDTGEVGTSGGGEPLEVKGVCSKGFGRDLNNSDTANTTCGKGSTSGVCPESGPIN